MMGRRGAYMALLAASVSVVATLAAGRARAGDSFEARWGAWVEAGGQVGTGRALGELDLFVPLSQDEDTLVFTDLRGMVDDQSANEANLGFGLRQMDPSGWNFGVYGYVDTRRSASGNRFQQLTFGAEALSETVDLRGNVYLPVGPNEVRTALGSSSSSGAWTSAAITTGSSLAIERRQVETTTTRYDMEKALAGIDAEVGLRLPVFEPGSGFDLRAFFGGYYFDGSGVEAVAGPRLRLELGAQDLAGLPGVKLTGGLTYQSDQVRGDQWIVGARLRVPLQPPAAAPDRALSAMERRMTDAVVRDVDIVSNRATVSQASDTTFITTEDAINVSNGTTVSSFRAVEGAAGDAALQAALDAAGTGGVVLLTGDLSAPGGILLNAGQSLIGGGGSLRLRGVSSGTEVDFTAAGSAGRITGADDALVTMASGATLSGVTVVNTATGANDFAIVGASDATLRNVDVVSATNGVKAAGTSGFTLEGGSLRANGGTALMLANSSGLDIRGATIEQTGASGIGIRADAAAGTIRDMTITTRGNGNGLDDTDSAARPSHALSVNASGGLEISGNTIETHGTQANGVHVTNSGGIRIADNTITTRNYMSRGIHLLNSSAAEISGNTITTLTTNDSNWSVLTIAFGLIASNSSDLVIRDNVISTAMRGGYGVNIRYGTNNLVEGNTVTTGGEDATGINLVRSESAMIRNNDITTTALLSAAPGISFGVFSHHGTAEGNTVTVMGGTAGVVVNAASNITVRGNRLVGRGDSGVWTNEGDTVISGNTP